MNIFSVLALIFASFNLIYTLQVNLGVLNYKSSDPLNGIVIDRIRRYYISQPNEIQVEFYSTTISDSNILSANDTLCGLTALGLIGIVGPTASPVIPTIQSVSFNLEVPHIQYFWKAPDSSASPATSMFLNFYPDSELLAKGFAALISYMDWKSLTVLYETADGLTRLKNVLNMTVRADIPMIFRHIPPGIDYRIVFKDIRNHTENTIVLECEVDRIFDILQKAKEVNMLGEHPRYFLANLDAHTLDFGPLNTTANITTIRMLNTTSYKLINTVKDWNDDTKSYVTPETARVEQVLLRDAVYFLMKGFYDLSKVDRDMHVSYPQYCDEPIPSQKGFRLYKYLINKTDEGFPGPIEFASGPIQFDEKGNRIDFRLYSVEIIENKKEVLADWRPSMNKSVHLYRNQTQTEEAAVQNLQKILVKVASKLIPPYLFKKNDSSLKGNDALEGYAFDLINEIAKLKNFTFKFELYDDVGKYTSATKSWSGIIRDLIDRKVHLAICDFTITEARREVIDFSLPFMNLGISILHVSAKAQDPSKFAFMDPFDVEVWAYTVTLYLLISTVLYVICRFAPGDWENPHPCDPDPDELENIWDLKNCFWLTLGSIMTQGCDILPKGISSRMGTSMWWFFSLIMTSSYTANLAAFLTKKNMGMTINNAEDLAKQSKIRYGTVLNGATMNFFKNSNFTTYQRLWNNMIQWKPSVFETTNEGGVKRVLSAKNQLYAFFMESTSIEYEMKKNCDLKQVGGRLDSKGYGIGMPMNSYYRSVIDQAILKLQESGKLAELKGKWWKQQVECDEQSNSDADSSLKLGNVGGVFIVLGAGVALAFLLAFVEFLWNVHQIAVEEHISYSDALTIELKFAFKVWITKKRVKPVLSESSSHGSDTRSVAQRVMKTASSFINLDLFDTKKN